MSGPWLERPEQIDTLGIERTTGAAMLAIIDAVDWTDEARHLRLVQTKLNWYLEFIASGQIYDDYPDAKGRSIVIVWRHRYPLPRAAQEFIVRARVPIAEMGVELRAVRIVDPGSDS